MSELTPSQEHALATFKACMHFPDNGFHDLIIELCKTYQLSFQKVRKVLMSSQRNIEKQIRHDFEHVTEQQLSKHYWLTLVHAQLKEMAQSNIAVMQALQANANYQKAQASIDAKIHTEDEREAVLECLFLAYEKEVFKPLAAMLHTTPIYWKLMRAEEIRTMTTEYQTHFIDYPEYMSAANHLFVIEQNVRALKL
ncbi:hypothetical protein [Vibrio ezurae]|uniref:Uncharacterized protein n=1 Tax=Vibrio ezurae NBRC 102218 TaxID=1219080 RepID=U3AZ83_9VIBR|nr:hypothetical protein [Vibrio ezurae]GAD79055.1 hypothetical protein VEZ01S_08_00910 [Vibrio ezurae NBRC 102218]